MPSPVQISALVVGCQTWPLPPVARITALAPKWSIEPSLTLRQIAPTQLPSSSRARLGGEVLLVAGDLLGVLHELLVEDVHDRLAGDVGDVVGARGRGAAEGPRTELALLVAVEGDPEVLEVEELLRRRLAHDLDRVLVGQVVGALDGVEGVRLPAVVLLERRVDAALRGVGVRADGVDLADDSDRDALFGGCKRGPLSREARPDHQDVMVRHDRYSVRARASENRAGQGRRAQPLLAARASPRTQSGEVFAAARVRAEWRSGRIGTNRSYKARPGGRP